MDDDPRKATTAEEDPSEGESTHPEPGPSGERTQAQGLALDEDDRDIYPL